MAREMKDSGIEWIGEIPESWETAPLKFCLKESMVYGSTSSGVFFKEGMPRYIRITDIDSNGCLKDENKQSISLEGNERYVIRENDLLFARSGATVGKTYLAKAADEGNVFAGYLIRACIDQTKLLPKYAYYFTRTSSYMNWVRMSYSMATIQNVGADKYRELQVTLPSLAEQYRIVDYLDYKCSLVDKLSSNIENQIAKLAEYKRALIAQVVTKGLNPDVEMKDSGIEWIGEIPASWNTTKVKYISTITNGSDPKTEGDIPVYGSGANSFKTCGEFKNGPCVLLGRKGATLNIPHYIEGKYWNVDTAFDAKTNDDFFDLKYFFYLACCFDYKFFISQTTLPGMSQTHYNNMFIPSPALLEQKEISNYLDNKCSQIDKLQSRLQEKLPRLAAYKKSLIYDYVTGKKEVPADFRKGVLHE